MNAVIEESPEPDAGTADRARAALARAWAAARAAAGAERPEALRRLRDAAAAAGEVDLARTVFSAERAGDAETLLGPPPVETPAAPIDPPAEDTTAVDPEGAAAPAGAVETLRLRITVAPDRAPAARRKVVRRLLERTFEVAAWRETEEGAAAEVRADPAALAALLDGVPDVRWETDQTLRMTVAA